MKRHGSRRALSVTMAIIVAAGSFLLPHTASAVDIYSTPGTHQVNGRTWRTTCAPYSSTVKRCRTDIIATTIVSSQGRYTSTTDWTFNNLTYLPSPRANWRGNPLATPGEHMLGGRQWKTECDTPAVGRNGCRSWIRARVVSVTGGNPARYTTQLTWVFNNIVRFSTNGSPATPITPTPPPSTGSGNPTAPTKACVGVPTPTGYRVGANGMPSPPANAEQPANTHNPQYIGNFIRQVLKDGRTTTEQKKCLAGTAAGHLIARSHTRVIDGVTSRWYPFDFAFSANPSVPELTSPWYSGLGQANVLTLTVLMRDLTGDPIWEKYGRETFESFLVPTSNGGIASREKGFLWFEHYPTTPPTSVLNGHFEALIGLAYWGRNMDEPRATALVREAVSQLRPLLVASEVEVEAGLMAAYDLVRGFPAAPLRFLATSPTFRWDSAKLNGQFQDIPTVTSSAPAGRNVLRNSTMDAVTDGLPQHWRALGTRSQVSASGGIVRVVSNGNAWQGVVQSVAPGTFNAGEPLHLAVRSRVTLPSGKPGTSGKVMAYQLCSRVYTVLHTTTKLRSSAWTSYDLTFPAPKAGCSLEIRLSTGDQGPANTTVEFDDVVLARADVLGKGTAPRYDLFVDRTPVNTVSVTGTGSAVLQAYSDGRWQSVGSVSLSPGSPSQIVVPERFTGRNMHYGYHENHVVELMTLNSLMPDPLLVEFARRWAPLAPHHNGLVPQGTSKTARLVADPNAVVGDWLTTGVEGPEGGLGDTP